MSRRGLTLVEILISFSILSFLAVMIYSVVRATVEVHDEIEAVLNETEPPPAILNIIRQDIESAFLPDNEKTYFFGENKSLQFGPANELQLLSSNAAYGKADGEADANLHAFNEVGYRLADSPVDGNFLVLYRREDYFVDGKPLEGGTLVELYDRVRTLQFRYWDGKEWKDEWDSKAAQGKLPLGVRVVITIGTAAPNEEPRIHTHAIYVPLLQ